MQTLYEVLPQVMIQFKIKIKLKLHVIINRKIAFDIIKHKNNPFKKKCFSLSLSVLEKKVIIMLKLNCRMILNLIFKAVSVNSCKSSCKDTRFTTVPLKL